LVLVCLSAIMQYNHKNERTAKYVNGDFRLYVYDESSHLVGEYTVTGQPIVEYVWLGDTPIAALYPNNAVVYLLTDHQNKPRRGVNAATKRVDWTWDPDAFGVFQPSLARVEVNLRFPGQYYDKHTGLYYNHHRYYNPQIGRYMEPDPIGLAGGLNPYAYANNNPVMEVDPSGLNPALLVIGGIWLLDNFRADSSTGRSNHAPPSGIGDAAMAATPPGRLATTIGVGTGRAAGATRGGAPRNPDGTFANVGGSTAGKKVDSATRQRILRRDQNADGSWTCATCGHSTSNPANIHTGHVKARSKGGDLSDGNLRCEGAACNLSQGAGSAPNPARTCAARGSCGATYGRTD